MDLSNFKLQYPNISIPLLYEACSHFPIVNRGGDEFKEWKENMSRVHLFSISDNLMLGNPKYAIRREMADNNTKSECETSERYLDSSVHPRADTKTFLLCEEEKAYLPPGFEKYNHNTTTGPVDNYAYVPSQYDRIKLAKGMR